MLEEVKDFAEKDSQEAIDYINAFIEQSIPREIPQNLKDFCSSLGKLHDYTTYGCCYLLLAFLLFPIYLTPGLGLFFWILIGIALPPCIIGFFSLMNYKKRLNILKTGKIYKASISDIKESYTSRLKSPVFQLTLDVITDDKNMICKSYVQKEAINYFEEMMDSINNNSVDILYNGKKEVIIPLNLALMYTVLKNSSYSS